MNHWDEMYLDLCRRVARESKEINIKVGAYIADPDHRPVGFGFNGFPRGVRDTPERYLEPGQRRVVHAELNAIMNAHGSCKGCTLYLTPVQPCPTCAGAIIQSGIRRVVASGPKNLIMEWQPEWVAITKDMFNEAGVELVVLNDKPPAL